MERFDITVIGAGPAGVCAAVEAARCGMRVLLVENSTICGGMLKRGGLPNVGYFLPGGRRSSAASAGNWLRSALC